MSDFLNYFSEEMVYTFTLYPTASGLNANGNPNEGFSDTASITDKKCAFYEGSAAASFVADRFKTDLSGVLICDTTDEIGDNAKVLLSDGHEYAVIHADNVLGINDAYVVALTTPDDGGNLE